MTHRGPMQHFGPKAPWKVNTALEIALLKNEPCNLTLWGTSALFLSCLLSVYDCFLAGLETVCGNKQMQSS